MHAVNRVGIAAGCLAAAFCSPADATLYSGNFGDAGNAALVASNLTAAQFTDPNAIANNVAVYTITVPIAETVTFSSQDFPPAGAEPYFSLFRSVADGGAWLASNYNQAFSTGGDFSYSATLAPGSYLMTLGVFANESFAENLGTGSYSDGFTAFGSASYLGSGAYAVNVTLANATVVPEPTQAILLALGVGALLLRPRPRPRR